MEYVPIAIDMHILWKRYRLTKEQSKLMFFTEGSVFEGWVNSMLVSYHYGKGINLREQAGISKKIKIYCDSGGFQLITGLTDHIDLTDLVEWQNENADIAFILDVPPIDKRMRILDWDTFVRCAEKTKENVEKTIDKLDTRVFGILHGTTFKEMDYWYRKLSDFSFDGWAIATKKGVEEPKFDVLVKQLIFARNVGMERVHVLGVGGASIPFFGWLEREGYFKKISFDVSSSNLARYAGYILPNGKRIKLSRRKRFISDILPCDCPICQYVAKHGVDWFTAAIGDTKRVFLLDMHNLYVCLRNFRMWQAIVNHPDFLEIVPKETLDMIKRFHSNIEGGLLAWLD